MGDLSRSKEDPRTRTVSISDSTNTTNVPEFRSPIMKLCFMFILTSYGT